MSQTASLPSPRKLLVPLLAVGGLAVMAYAVVSGEKDYPPAPPVAAPARSPFAETIAGAGLVEAASQNIAVGTPLSGIVAAVYVEVGQEIAAGAPLFVLDDRQARADLAAREASRLLAEARVPEARALLAEAELQARRVTGIEDARAVSAEEVERRATQLTSARARLAAAEAAVAQARAEAAAARTLLERHTVRAPIAGQVLQRNVRPGEHVGDGPTPVLVLGDTRTLHVRVDIDENDAWRVRPGAKARASLRGNAELATEVLWVRGEPLVVPKKSLTGASVERVDTRVMQVLFAFERHRLPVQVGQQLDVFIEAAPAGGRS